MDGAGQALFQGSFGKEELSQSVCQFVSQWDREKMDESCDARRQSERASGEKHGVIGER